MHRSKSIRRALVVAVAAAGVWALGTGGAQAGELPSAGKTLTDVTKATKTAKSSKITKVTRIRPADQVEHVTRATQGVDDTVGRTVEESEEGVRQGAGKAVGHVTKEAREAVSSAATAPAHQDLGAVSGVPSAAAAPSTPGLPEDLVIEIPQLVPGVPSIGILPSSIPALPVTPTIPVL